MVHISNPKVLEMEGVAPLHICPKCSPLIETRMKKLILLLAVLLLSGCAGLKPYSGTVTTPDGEVYRVEQSKPGAIEMEDAKKQIKIKADTKSESFLDKLHNWMMMRSVQKIEK